MPKILFLSLFLVSCATSTSPKARFPADEGFYTLPAERSGYDTATINKVKASVGQLFVEKKIKFAKWEIEQLRKLYCSSEEGLFWLGSLCTQWMERKCDEGCEIEEFVPSCSGGKVGSRFVTAKHCMPKGTNRMKAKFVGEDSAVVEILLRADKEALHNQPYDISILHPQVEALFDKIPSLEIDSKMKNDESVFSVGFPYVTKDIRPKKKSDYDYASIGMRITFGKIVDSNPKGWAYCVYSNNISQAGPENWVLEESCVSVDYSQYKYNAREERNIVLTDTDMIYGMSGSLLFSVEGKVLGIGSTVKTSSPGNYSPLKPAVYSKAENVGRILNAK